LGSEYKYFFSESFGLVSKPKVSYLSFSFLFCASKKIEEMITESSLNIYSVKLSLTLTFFWTNKNFFHKLVIDYIALQGDVSGLHIKA